MRTKFSLIRRIHSFKYAFNGLKIFFREEHNALIHLVAAIAAVILGVVLDISTNEWMLLVITIGFVIGIEILNTSIENICDFISPENDIRIKKIKDLSAAAVLTSSIAAFVIGLLLFIPKIISL